MIVISPTVGSTAKNLVVIYAYPNTIYASVYDNNDTTEHYFAISLAASGNANKWHACELYIDFADQTKSYFIYDGTTDTTFAGGNPHASGVDWTTRYIHVGNWAGYPAFSRIRNLLITYN
jgi:hypothetical protein